jgi:hypothetical protein
MKFIIYNFIPPDSRGNLTLRGTPNKSQIPSEEAMASPLMASDTIPNAHNEDFMPIAWETLYQSVTMWNQHPIAVFINMARIYSKKHNIQT